MPEADKLAHLAPAAQPAMHPRGGAGGRRLPAQQRCHRAAIGGTVGGVLRHQQVQQIEGQRRGRQLGRRGQVSPSHPDRPTLRRRFHPERNLLDLLVLREGLRDLIYVSQQVKDLKILKEKATSSAKTKRLNEAKRFSFRNYFELFLIPSISGNEDPSAILRNSSFYNLGETIKNNKNIFVITNQDDFLVTPADIEYLKTVAADRLYLYPYGGHVGNLWYHVNSNDFLEIMKPF